MKNNKIIKKLAGIALLSSTLFMPLTSCTSIFEEEGFVIKDITWSTNENSGNTEIILNTTKEENPEMKIDIPAVGIKNITSEINKEETEIKLTISYTDKAKTPTVVTIPIIKGKDGKGIEKLLVGTDENGDTTLQFVYTDKTQSEVIKIKSGKDGVSIDQILTDDSDPKFIYITITFSDYTLPQKLIKIPKPEAGVSIKEIKYDKEASDETNYVLTITYSDETTENVTLPKPKGTTWYYGEEKPTEAIGEPGDYYLNNSNGHIYYKTTNGWTFIFSMDGTGSYTEKVIKFNPGEGSWVDPKLIPGASYKLLVKYGSYVSLEKFPQITRENYNFEGWYTTTKINPNGGHFTDLTPVTQDMSLYPRWSAK